MPELRVYRSPWRDFPDVIIQTNMTKLQAHPAYRAAKEGDMVAAFRVVESVRKPSKLRWEADEIVAVAQFDRDKKNALPIAYAILLGREIGVPVNRTVIQENIVSHTGANAPTRILGQPIFDGSIPPGKRILIVDDVVTFGATLANLRGFIESRGSTVVGASTLSASYGGTKLALPEHVKETLFGRFPSVTGLANELGFEPDCFTNREARFLSNLKEQERTALMAAVKDRQQVRTQGIDLDRRPS
jgi:adenine/guanine phosphoribosyltransferase-like PRPP-binding protein